MTRRGIQKTVFKYLLPVAVAASLWFVHPPAAAQQPAILPESIAFEWDANTETNIAGYICTIQTPEGAITNVTKATQTRAVFSPFPLLPTPWTVTVKAVNIHGFVSQPSVPLLLTAPIRTVGLRAVVTIELGGTTALRTGVVSQDGTQAKMLP